jgi:hypothetical protein
MFTLIQTRGCLPSNRNRCDGEGQTRWGVSLRAKRGEGCDPWYDPPHSGVRCGRRPPANVSSNLRSSYSASFPILRSVLGSSSNRVQLEYKRRTPPQPKTLARVGRCERMYRPQRILASRLIQLPKLQACACITSSRDTHRLFHSTSIMKEVEVVYDPVRPLFTRTLTCTRRFSARPCVVSLVAAGSASPIAPGAITCRTGMLQSWSR